MRVIRTVSSLLTLSALCVTATGVAGAQQTAQQTAQATAQQVTVPLSDPSRPGTLSVNLMQGGVTIRGTNRMDVLVEAQSIEERRGSGRGRGGGRSPDSAAGLRRIVQSGGFAIEENNNQIRLTSSSNHEGTNFTIQVPARTNLKLTTLNDGPIVVENVEGEIEVNNHNESVTMTNVAGSVVANAHNGHVKVVMTRLASDKAMAFTSFNGNVDVTLPPSVKANLRLRSDMGEVFTDFDIQVRPATTAASQAVRGRDGRIRIDVNQSVQGTVNGGGPEFELRTFNGNIYVRRGAQ
jgi:hypothetical protein